MISDTDGHRKIVKIELTGEQDKLQSNKKRKEPSETGLERPKSKKRKVIENQKTQENVSSPGYIEKPFIGQKVMSEFIQNDGQSFWVEGEVQQVFKKTCAVLYSDGDYRPRTKLQELFRLDESFIKRMK